MNETQSSSNSAFLDSVYFSSGFNPQIRIPLSTAQAKAVSNLAHRLRTEGKHTEVDPGMPYGSFWIGGQEQRWAEKHLFIPDKKHPGWIYVADDLLKKLCDRVEAGAKNPYDFNSNDWNAVLLVLETDGK
jgi:hypothetical protein